MTLDYLVASAAADRNVFADRRAKTDPPQQYPYARVAGGYREAVYGKANPDSRAGFDVADLQAMERRLPAADRKRAETEATRSSRRC